MKSHEGLVDDCDIKSTLPADLGCFIVGSSKRNVNIFVREINGFHIIVYTTERRIACIWRKIIRMFWIKLVQLLINYCNLKKIMKQEVSLTVHS